MADPEDISPYGHAPLPAVDPIVLRLVDSLAPADDRAARLSDRLLEDLGFSSLRLLELAFMVEDVFAMDPAAVGEAPSVGTIRELCDFIAGKVRVGEATMPTSAVVEATVANL